MNYRADGVALVGGIPVTELVAEFGSPLYVYDAAELAAAYGRLRQALPADVKILYSLKANPSLSVTALLHRLGAGAEVSSLGELRTAEAAGIPAAEILFLGPGKTGVELEAGVNASVGCMVAESWLELELLDHLGERLQRRLPVAIRVNPAFTTKGAMLTMGGAARQFGIDEEQFSGKRSFLASLHNLDIVGFHAYLGTRILNHETILQNTAGIFDLALRLAGELGVDMRMLDIGGGWGVAYHEGEHELDMAALGAGMAPLVDQFRAATGGRVQLMVESGRYLTAQAGLYVTRVLYMKESRGERFAVADGGTNHHMAAVGIGSPIKRNFPVVALTRRPGSTTMIPTHMCGPLCTPGDVVAKSAALPDLVPGDLLGVQMSGAYGPSASPIHFLSHGHPAEVLLHEGKAHLIRRATTPDDLLAPQTLTRF